MDENKQILLIATLETQVKKLKAENQGLLRANEALKIENEAFARLRAEKLVPVLPTKKRHLTTRLRVDGSPAVKWGIVMEAVEMAKGMTAREIVQKTGFDRYAVYSAARRLGIKLKPASRKQR